MRRGTRRLGGTEVFELRVSARWQNPAHTEDLGSLGGAIFPAKPAKRTRLVRPVSPVSRSGQTPAESKPIIHWDRTPLAAAPRSVEGLGLRWNMVGDCGSTG